MLEDIRGKGVLVTGASTGIGAAVAKAFAALGANVAVHYNRSKDAAEAVVADIETAGGGAFAVAGDLSQADSGAAVVADAVERLGRLDIVVNNAGAILDRKPFEELSLDLYQAALDLNVRSVIVVSQAAVPHLEAQGGGTIVNVGSIAGSNGGGPGSAHYASAKAYIHNLTRAMAKELAPKGIRVNALAPGVIDTPFHAATPADRMESMRQAVGAGPARDGGGLRRTDGVSRLGDERLRHRTDPARERRTVHAVTRCDRIGRRGTRVTRRTAFNVLRLLQKLRMDRARLVRGCGFGGLTAGMASSERSSGPGWLGCRGSGGSGTGARPGEGGGSGGPGPQQSGSAGRIEGEQGQVNLQRGSAPGRGRSCAWSCRRSSPRDSAPRRPFGSRLVGPRPSPTPCARSPAARSAEHRAAPAPRRDLHDCHRRCRPGRAGRTGSKPRLSCTSAGVTRTFRTRPPFSSTAAMRLVALHRGPVRAGVDAPVGLAVDLRHLPHHGRVDRRRPAPPPTPRPTGRARPPAAAP